MSAFEVQNKTINRFDDNYMEKTAIKTSAIKLEEFNHCPEADAVTHYLYTHVLQPYIRTVDLDSPHGFLANNRNTLVLAILKGPTETKVALALGQMAVRFAVADFSWIVLEDTTIVRLWWE